MSPQAYQKTSLQSRRSHGCGCMRVLSKGVTSCRRGPGMLNSRREEGHIGHERPHRRHCLVRRYGDARAKLLCCPAQNRGGRPQTVPDAGGRRIPAAAGRGDGEGRASASRATTKARSTSCSSRSPCLMPPTASCRRCRCRHCPRRGRRRLLRRGSPQGTCPDPSRAGRRSAAWFRRLSQAARRWIP